MFISRKFFSTNFSFPSMPRSAGRPRVMLETASVAGGAVAALFLSSIVGIFVYVRWHQRHKLEGVEAEGSLQNTSQNGQSNGHTNAGADVVDGPSRNGLTPCYCEQSSLRYSNQIISQVPTSASNGECSSHTELQHPQQQLFQAVPHYHRPMRPFGPHHYQPLTMEHAIELILEPNSQQTRL